jgi:hypothetical protein
MRKSLTLILLAPLAVACATPGKRTAIGAGGGAAVGAGVGAKALPASRATAASPARAGVLAVAAVPPMRPPRSSSRTAAASR